MQASQSERTDESEAQLAPNTRKGKGVSATSPDKPGAKHAPGNQSRKRSPRKPPVSKQTKMIDLLQRPGGATLSALARASGWQQHSIRAFLAVTVRKKLKLNLRRMEKDGTSYYFIAHRTPSKKVGR